jgi:hypothetical protein
VFALHCCENAEAEETAFLLGKSKGILAGVPFFTGNVL